MQKCHFSGNGVKSCLMKKSRHKDSLSFPVITKAHVYLGDAYSARGAASPRPQTRLRGDSGPGHGESAAVGVSALCSLLLHFPPGFWQGDGETHGPEATRWAFAAGKGRRGRAGTERQRFAWRRAEGLLEGPLLPSGSRRQTCHLCDTQDTRGLPQPRGEWWWTEAQRTLVWTTLTLTWGRGGSHPDPTLPRSPSAPPRWEAKRSFSTPTSLGVRQSPASPLTSLGVKCGLSSELLGPRCALRPGVRPGVPA